MGVRITDVERDLTVDESVVHAWIDSGLQLQGVFMVLGSAKWS